MSDESCKKRVYSLRGHEGGYQRQHIITVTIPAASGCVVMASINVFSFIVSFLPLCVALYWCTAGPAGGVWCGLVPLKALFPIDGKPALNGVFACEKELNLSSTFFARFSVRRYAAVQLLWFLCSGVRDTGKDFPIRWETESSRRKEKPKQADLSHRC